jgi:hypothetical protein
MHTNSLNILCNNRFEKNPQMAQAKTTKQKKQNNGADVGYEGELWQMADALRGSMDAAEHNYVALGLIYPVPPATAFEPFHALAQRLYAGIDVLAGESDTLPALRDTVLPKPIFDELRLAQQNDPITTSA